MKKIVIGTIVGLSLLLVFSGCGNDKKKTQVSEDKASEVDKQTNMENISLESSSKLKKEYSGESLDNSNSAASSQTSAGSTELQTTEVRNSSSEETIDTKNLTTGQVKQWVFNNMPFNTDKFTQNDYIFDMIKGDDGELYIGVLENHSTPAMKAAGTNESVMPRVGSFKIDSEGHLLRSEDAGVTYQKVSDHFN